MFLVYLLDRKYWTLHNLLLPSNECHRKLQEGNGKLTSVCSMLSAPISETIGRLGTYRIAPPLAALFTLGAGFAPNMAALCILRLFAGFFGGAPLPVMAGTGADLFAPKDFAVAGSIMLYTPFLGRSFVDHYSQYHT
jgi:hypothetical protein